MLYILKILACRFKTRAKIYTISLLTRMRGKRRIHVLHIGKTGGTVLKEALRGVLEGPQYRVFLHDHNVKLTDIPHADEVVIFLRDPLGRFVSGFNSRKREGRPRYRFPHTSEEKKAFTIFPTPNSLAEALSSSDPRERKAAVTAMRSIGHVRTFYRDWLISIEELLSRKNRIFIGRTEDLNTDFEILKAWIGINSKVHLPNDPVKAHKAPEGYDTYLSPLAQKNLQEWYADDYVFLEAAMQIRREILGKLGLST